MLIARAPFCLPFPDCDFKGYKEPMKTEEKKIYLVDSGLSFNLPFPLMLRPQRGIELYITFDFSSRNSDSTPPFRVSSPLSSKFPSDAGWKLIW